MEFQELYNYAIEKGEIPDEAFCDNCGGALVTEEQAHELEYLFYSERGSHNVILIDVCSCMGSPASLESRS